jgi:hypothetical protein
MPKTDSRETTGPPITEKTSQALKRAAQLLNQHEMVPKPHQHINGFAREYYQLEGDFALMVMFAAAARNHLGVTIDGHITERNDDPNQPSLVHTFVHIDLPDEDRGQAVIVWPGYFNDQGQQVDPHNGTWQRLLIRPLTQPEGQALAMDLYDMATE